MLTHPTLDKLRTMKLDGMALALQEQLELSSSQDSVLKKGWAC
jgi:hypothetical protein